jgi:hypothetical protein
MWFFPTSIGHSSWCMCEVNLWFHQSYYKICDVYCGTFIIWNHFNLTLCLCHIQLWWSSWCFPWNSHYVSHNHFMMHHNPLRTRLVSAHYASCLFCCLCHLSPQGQLTQHNGPLPIPEYISLPGNWESFPLLSFQNVLVCNFFMFL